MADLGPVTVCHKGGDYSKQGDYARISRAQYDADPGRYTLYPPKAKKAPTKKAPAKKAPAKDDE